MRKSYRLRLVRDSEQHNKPRKPPATPIIEQPARQAVARGIYSDPASFGTYALAAFDHSGNCVLHVMCDPVHADGIAAWMYDWLDEHCPALPTLVR
jgi:hypothetical protein